MGRTILAEERLQKYIENLFKTESWSIGLIIGQQTTQRDYAVHMVRTPPQEDEEDDDVNLEDDPEIEPAPRPVRTLQTVTDVWVVTHARQALKMLPGGLNIIGIFAMAPPAVMTTVQNKLKLILYSIHKMTSKVGGAWMSFEDDVTERIMLHICPTTRKIVCRTYDMADNSGASKPADWKYQSYLDRWVTIATNVSIDLTCRVPVEVMCQSLLKQIQNTVSRYCNNVWDAVVTLNNRILPPEAAIAAPSGGDAGGGGGGGKRGKKHAAAAQDTQAKQFYAEIYAQLSSSTTGIYTVDSGGLMVVRGTMACRAYLNNKSSFKDATNAIKRDVIRSLLSRVELLCEDFATNEEEQYPKVVIETPKRIFAEYPDSPICFCDYSFPDEKLFESKERFQDLLDLHVKEEQLDTASESLPSKDDLEEAEKIPERLELPKKKRLTLRKALSYAVSGAIAIVAAGVSYLYLSEEY